MKMFVRTGRIAFGACLVGLGIQGMFYTDFDPVFLPDASSWLPYHTVLEYVWSLVLILSGLSIILEKRSREVSLVLGGIFLILFLFFHVPHLLFGNPNGKALGSWTKALKGLA